MFKTKLKFLSLNNERINDSSLFDKSWFSKVKFNNRRINGTIGSFDEHLHLISWNSQLTKWNEFNVKSETIKSRITFSIHEASTEICVGNAKFDLFARMQQKDDSNFTDTVCIDFNSFKGFDAFKDSKLAFDLCTTNLHIDLFKKKSYARKPNVCEYLNIHLMLHELFVSESLYKHGFIQIKINTILHNTKSMNLDKSIKFGEYFFIPIKFFELFENFIEINLIEEHHIFKHQNNKLGTFSMLLKRIYSGEFSNINENCGFGNKWIKLSSKVYLKTSIFINSNDYSPIDDDDDNGDFNKDFDFISDVSNLLISSGKQASFTLYYAEFFKNNMLHSNRDLTLSCSLKFKSEKKHNDLVIDVKKICAQEIENGILKICQELLIKIGNEDYSCIVFEFFTNDNRRFYASIRCHDLLSVKFGPVMLKLTEDLNGLNAFGRILITFQFSSSNMRDELVRIKSYECDINALILKHSKSCNYIFMVVINGAYQLPSVLNGSIRFFAKVASQSSKTSYFDIKNDRPRFAKNIKWPDEKPVLIVQLKWPSQVYRITVLNFIDNLIRQCLNACQDNRKLIFIQSFEKFKLLEKNIEDDSDMNIQSLISVHLDNLLNEVENFKIHIELLSKLVELLNDLIILPDIQILIKKRQHFRSKLLYEIQIKPQNVLYSTTENIFGNHNDYHILQDNRNDQFNSFQPLLDVNAYFFLSLLDLISFFKNNFVRLFLKEPSENKHKQFSHENELFLFEIQFYSSEENWETVFFIDKSLKKHKTKEEIKLDKRYFCVSEWYLVDENWTYSNHYKENIWFTKNFDSLFKYRRCKWIKKVCLKISKTSECSSLNIDENISVCSTKKSCIFIRTLQPTLKVYSFCVKIIETKILWNMFSTLKKSITNQNTSRFFYSLKIFIFDIHKNFPTQQLSEKINVLSISVNPKWESKLEFNIEISEHQTNLPIFFEISLNLFRFNRIKKYSLGKSFLNFKFKDELLKRDLLKFGNSTSSKKKLFSSACFSLIDLELKLHENMTKIEKNEIKKIYKYVTITNFGIRFKQAFFKEKSKANNFFLVFVMNGIFFISQFKIKKNFSMFDNSANNDSEIVRFEKIPFYEEPYDLSSSVDIYLSDHCDLSSSSFIKHITGYNRISEIYKYNQSFNKYKPVYDKKPRLDRSRLDNTAFFSKLKRIKKEDLIPCDENLNINKNIINNEVDFWTRYYDSLTLKHTNSDHMKQFKDILCLNILEHDLEHTFEGLCDYADGKIDLLSFTDSKIKLGELRFKTIISEDQKIIDESLVNSFSVLPTLSVIRLYIIKAFNLKDLINPHIEVICKGNNEDHDILLSNIDNSLKENFNHEFGEFFEFKVYVPEKLQLEVRILDKESHKFQLDHYDRLIGVTVIELENRLTSKYRATSGLPILYNDFVYDQTKTYYSNLLWREIMKPSEILTILCEKNKVSCKLDQENMLIELDNRNIGLSSFNFKYLDELYVATTNIFEQLCLNILNTEFNLVKEHIETRKIYKVEEGITIETGKIHLWVDIFPVQNSLDLKKLPPPVKIQKRKPISLELRCIVWSLDLISMNETKNIFVKIWLSGYDNKAQKSDTHFHCKNKANFNFRFVFEFDYLWQEKPKQSALKLHIQIFSSDLLNVHSHIMSSLEIDLNNLKWPQRMEDRPVLTNCNEVSQKKNSDDTNSTISLFKVGQICGWWPCESVAEDFKCSIKMTIEILNSNEAKKNPVGKGRTDPNINPKLDEPEREPFFDVTLLNPYHRFLQLSKHILLKKKKKYFVYMFLLVFILLCIWSIPSALINRIITRIL